MLYLVVLEIGVSALGEISSRSAAPDPTPSNDALVVVEARGYFRYAVAAFLGAFASVVVASWLASRRGQRPKNVAFTPADSVEALFTGIELPDPYGSSS
jgi:hypothetical protein